METKQKRIQELQYELNKALKDFACNYEVYAETTQGNKKIRGKHISLTFPIKVKIDIQEVVALFEKYYGDVKSVNKTTSFTDGTSGISKKEVILDLKDY